MSTLAPLAAAPLSDLLAGLPLRDLAVVMIAAGCAALLAHALRQPMVLGFLVAGTLISPHVDWHTLHVRNEDFMRLIAEMGATFLLFHLGLHFSLRACLRIGWATFLATIMQCLLMSLAGFWVGRLLGWERGQSVFLGALLSISSTVFVTRLLRDAGRLRTPEGETAVGMLLTQDVLAVGILALLPTFALQGSPQVADAVMQLGVVTVVLVLAAVAGLLLLPRFIGRFERAGSDEVLLIAALGLAFAAALVGEKLGFGAALGAFLCGAILAETPQRARISHLLLPLRDVFGGVFFVSAGMMVDLTRLPELWWPILALFLAAALFKIATATFAALLAGRSGSTSLAVGCIMVPIGEFSFIIAAMGVSLLGPSSADLYPLAAAVAILCMAAAPWLLKVSEPAARTLARVTPHPLSDSLRVYHLWLHRPHTPGDPVRAMLRKMGWQIALNMALVACILLGLHWSTPWLSARLPASPPFLSGVAQFLGWPRCGIGLAGGLLVLPILVAAGRKARAMSMLAAEYLLVGRHANAARLRPWLAHLFFGAMLLAMFALAAVLLAVLLASWIMVAMLATLLGASAWLLWNRLIRVHAQGQATLRAVLDDAATEGS